MDGPKQLKSYDQYQKYDHNTSPANPITLCVKEDLRMSTRTLTAYTDYPLTEAELACTDKQSPDYCRMKPCEILGFDGNKYCDVRIVDENGNHEHEVVSIKAGYLYPDPYSYDEYGGHISYTYKYLKEYFNAKNA